MPQIINHTVQIDQIIDTIIESAITSVSKRICEKLAEFIQLDYYDMYAPKRYIRENKFLRSAAYTIIDPHTSKIYIDKDNMNYDNGFSADQILQWAELGFHGSYDISTDGYFWSSFSMWCNENVVSMLIIELKKLGIKPK